MKGSFPKKLKSLRDKNSTHRRNKSSEPNNHPKVGMRLGALARKSVIGIPSKQAAKEEQERERIDANVELIANRCDELKFHNITKDHIRFALLSKYSEGDVDSAIELIQLQQQAFSGILLPYNPNVEMVGAENRESVTCYLDALLFAMYAKLEAFECMLKNEQLDENQRNLAALIRLWVNMLRSGKLIRTDMTETIQNALASCGWQDARELQQQDTSEAFAFITETLQLPLLTLQVDLFHQGERDEDDHKVVYERLLNLAVPPDPEGKGVQLEDCLEDYFNTRVDVLRDSLQDKKSTERAALAPGETKLAIFPENSVEAALKTDTTSVMEMTAAATPGAEVAADTTDTPADTSADTSANTSADTSADPLADSAEIAETVPDSDVHVLSESGDNVPNIDGRDASVSSSKDTTKADNTSSSAAASALDVAKSLGGTDSPPAVAAQPDTSELEPTTVASPTTINSHTDRTSETFDHDPAPMVRRWNSLVLDTTNPESPAESSTAAERRSISASTLRQRSASIIQRIVIEDGKPSEPQEASTLLKQRERRGSTIMKAITIPAWQFFRLIPWHLSSNSEPQSDVEVIRQFNKRPVVGICLKRYMMNSKGQFERQNTYIDIPDSLRLPYFMMSEDGRPREGNELSTGYKLVLQSAVCHRGISLHSGHYISFARVNPVMLTDNRRHESDPPPDYEEQQWVKFDDLDPDSRVTPVDDIKASLKEDMPYLLFYQIVPMMDMESSVTSLDEIKEPPSYNDSAIMGPGTPLPVDATVLGNASSYFDPSTWGGSTTTGPSIRFSSEMDGTPRFSLDDESNGSSSFLANAYRKATDSASRRGSLAFTNSIVGTPLITPEGGRSPVISPSDEPSTAQRLSRAAARLTSRSSRSRPPSQTGEGRKSLTMSRLGSLVRSSKEPLRFSEDGTDASTVTIPLPAAANSTSLLTAVHTAPASASSLTFGLPLETVPSADSGLPHTTLPSTASPSWPQKPENADDGRHHHHHHHYHNYHFRRKEREADTSTEAGTTEGGDYVLADGSKGKGKDKEKTKNKSGVPERECSVM
ncbi:hypothetical protein SEPCBS119000_001499 [Sporothrix epigloea]|uniref:ubiquitinyl hydrolase 1 n=1 Tax=Sporothrix epigloea TaxID=1892477 RepID=A0ABP0DE81_9PEZI